MVNTHAALVGKLLEKYGVVRWTMNHPTDTSRQLAKKIYDEQFANYADYDCIVQIVFPEVDCFVRMKEDPYYKEFIKPDHDKFADTARSKIIIGLFEEIIDNGKLIRS
ncbi:conidial pigment polyketide synthase PksP/Alb1 [Penicillium subrubescens]|nr:conidial pigment polyketide synthase PksP/Alb1 [Penicillium subrubescens]KAJ5896833.1 conidial pigment polyketide synthase PksP/Alb1 [Penicillium subrubescens]